MYTFLFFLITIFCINDISNAAIKPFPSLPSHFKDIPDLDELRFVLNTKSISSEDQLKVICWVLSQKHDQGLKGLLLYGPPGTGKSYLVKILKEILHADYLIKLSPVDLQTPQQVQKHFNQARKLASESSNMIILFLDEIDDLAKPESSVLNELLIQTAHKGNSKIAIIAATNYNEKLAPAFKRSGRFDIHVEIPLPQGPARAILLNEACKKLSAEGNLNLGYDQLIEVVKLTKGYSAADISTMVTLTKTMAQTKRKTQVDFADFASSIQTMKSQIQHAEPSNFTWLKTRATIFISNFLNKIRNSLFPEPKKPTITLPPSALRARL